MNSLLQKDYDPLGFLAVYTVYVYMCACLCVKYRQKETAWIELKCLLGKVKVESMY